MNYIYMNLKRLLRRKINLIFMLAAPFILVTFSSMMGGSSFGLNIAYVDNDKTQTSAMLINRLEKAGSIYEISEEEIEINLINGNHDLAVIINNGFEDKIIVNEIPFVELKSIQGSNISFPVSSQIDNFVSSALAISKTADNDLILYEKILSDYNKNESGVVVETVKNKGLMTMVTRMAIGFLFMNMLYLSAQSASVLIDDKKNKIYYRIFSGPVTAFKYMRDNIVSFYIIMIAQIVIIMFAMFGIYKMYYGDSLLNIFLLFLVFGIMSVSFGVAISTFSKSPSQAGAASSLIITPIAMLGGFFWDINFMPEFLQKFALILPTTWGIKAATSLLEGSSLYQISKHLLILLLFTIVFFVIGSLKKADIAR